MKTSTFIPFIAILIANSVFGQSAERIVNELKPALDCQTVAILNLDLERLDLTQLSEQLAEQLPKNAQAALSRELMGEQKDFLASLQNDGVTEFNIVFKLGPLTPDNQLIALKYQGESEPILKTLNQHRGLLGIDTKTKVGDQYIFIGVQKYKTPDWLQNTIAPADWYQRHSEEELQVLRTALADSGDAPLRFCFALTPDQKRALLEFSPETYGAGRATSIKNLEWLSLAISPQQEKIELKLKTASPESSTAIKAEIAKFFQAASQFESLMTNQPWLCRWLDELKLEGQGEQIRLSLQKQAYTNTVAAFSIPLLQTLNHQRDSLTLRRLQKIAIALHNYHDAHGKFPPRYSQDKNGKPLLSWRVLILPFLDELETYKKFALDEPWDSEQNLLAMGEFPSVYFPTGRLFRAATPYIAVGGKTAITEEGTKLNDIHDDHSATIAIVKLPDEAAVHWTKPGRFHLEPKELNETLNPSGGAGFWAAFCDAKVRYVPAELSAEELSQLFRANDGNPNQPESRLLELPLGFPAENGQTAPDYRPLQELPKIWFQELLESPWISGLSG